MKALLVIFFLTFAVAEAQHSTDLILIRSQIDAPLPGDLQKGEVKKSLNPFYWIAVGGVRFYQAIFSKQISAGCIYEMSCSHFGIESLKAHGPLKGLPLAIDRIMRCNRIAYTESSPLDFNSQGKLIDSPEFYRFE